MKMFKNKENTLSTRHKKVKTYKLDCVDTRPHRSAMNL